LNEANKQRDLSLQKLDGESLESWTKLADFLLEKSWIENDIAYLKQLLDLVETKKLNGLSFF
jgi:hypothetical protein